MPLKRNEWQALLTTLLVLILGATVSWLAGVDGSRWLGVPVFAVCGLLCFGINAAAFVPAYRKQTEHFFDLVGSVTYLVAVATAIALGAGDARSLLIAALVSVWTLRLGSFLFIRIRRAGKDGRFDDIKPSAPRFLLAWILQGLWVLLTLACGLSAMTSSAPRPLGPFAVFGVTIWTVGFAIEVVADRQKAKFRREPENRARFIETGLWAWSRHPNYLGEIILWVGIALLALPSLKGLQFFTLLSPLFVYFLLTRVSGIPLLEARAAERWGDDPDYAAYRDRTPVLFPRLRRRPRAGVRI